eukprot:2573099-Prymnesium_polylepis.1
MRPHGPRLKTPASSLSCSALSSARSMSHSQAASVAASAPALAPALGTRAKSKRLESADTAPAWNQKKIPPPGKTRPEEESEGGRILAGFDRSSWPHKHTQSQRGV